MMEFIQYVGDHPSVGLLVVFVVWLVFDGIADIVRAFRKENK